MSNAAAGAAFGAMMFFYWLMGLAGYVFGAICLMTLGNKLAYKNSWMAWVPVLNIYMMCELAEKPAWWLILFFIPGVNIVMAIIVWIRILERRGRPTWWILMFFIPVVNIIFMAMLAFSEAAPAVAPPVPPPPPPPGK
jgi:hypothetical protein